MSDFEFSFRSTSSEDTIFAGERLGELIERPLCVVLSGDLGAGKTQFSKGLAKALGVTDAITSPTFTIEMVYQGAKFSLYHFDLYRLSEAAQLDDIGLFEALEDEQGVSLIEWGEQFIDELPDERLELVLTREAVAEGEEPARLISVRAMGAAEAKLCELWQEALKA